MKTYAAIASVDDALDGNSSYAQILTFIDGPKDIVDFGCGPGNLARLLSERGSSITGVDVNPDHAAMAQEYCASVITADLESASLADLFPTQRFDVAIFADILEHLRNPERVLAGVTAILRPGGCVIASIPNVAHGAVRLSLLEGEFDYQSIGILDDTHVRFFTRRSMEAFFEKAGLVIENVSRTIAPIFEPSGTLVPAIDPASVSDAIKEQLRNDPDSETLQFIVKAMPASTAPRSVAKRRVARLERRVQDLEAELNKAKIELNQKLTVPSQLHHESVLQRLHEVTLELESAQETAASAVQASIEYRERLDSTLSEMHKNLEHNARLTGEIQILASSMEIAGAERSKLEILLSNANEAIEFERERGKKRDEQHEHLHAVLQHELEQLKQRTIERDQFRADRDTLTERLKTAQSEIEALGNYLAGIENRETQAVEAKESELRALKAEMREAVIRADYAEYFLEEMRKSKFWQLRNVWFRFKKVFGVSTDIP